jgi:hypothetical protein
MKVEETFREKFPKTWDKFNKETKAHIYLVPMNMASGFGNDPELFVNGLLFNIQLWTIDKGVAIIPKVTIPVIKEDYLINLYDGLIKAWEVFENKDRS